MRRGRPSDDSPVSGLAECVDSDITDWEGTGDLSSLGDTVEGPWRITCSDRNPWLNMSYFV